MALEAEIISAGMSRFDADAPRPGRIFLPLICLQPFDQNQFLVPHLKDLFSIFLEPEVHGHGTTFNICNHGSK